MYEQDEFINIVEKYKKKIISICYAYTEDIQEAEDLSQEVFISLYKNIHKFREECSLSTYIYKICISKVMDYKRKKSIKGFLNGLVFDFKDTAYEMDLDEKNYVREKLKRLPSGIRIPVVLYYYAGLNHKEIANIMNISPKSVEGRIYRGKQKLKIEFEREGYTRCKANGIV